MVNELTVLEANVLNMILAKGTFENPLRAAIIRQELGITKRHLETIIESLRVDFRHPIVSRKRQPSGYYLPRTEAEREAGLAANMRQIETEQRTVYLIKGVDLDNYWRGMHDGS